MRSSWLVHLILAIALVDGVALFSGQPQFISGVVADRHPLQLHGAGYEHLDCSACLTVAAVLAHRLNETLQTQSSTFLVSHRLDTTNKVRHHNYRGSELLVAEVLDGLCSSGTYQERQLRMNPDSKVRCYHGQFLEDLMQPPREGLREGEVFPAGSSATVIGENQEKRRYPIARLYSTRDNQALYGMYKTAAITMCDTLVDTYEEEMERMVQSAQSTEEIEHLLCGLPFTTNDNRHLDDLDDNDDDDEERLSNPVTDVCSNTEVLRAAAHRDQLRWERFDRRMKAHKLKAAASADAKKTTEPANSLDSSKHSNHGEVNDDL